MQRRARPLQQILAIAVLTVIAAQVPAPAHAEVALASQILETSDQNLPGLTASVFFNALNSPEQIDELEKVATEFRLKKTKLSTGNWKLSTFYNSIMPQSNDPRLKPLVDTWIKRWPGSPTPYIVNAHSMLLSILGTNQIETFSPANPQSLPIQTEKVKELQDYLDQHRDVAAADPHWFVLRARAALLTGITEADFNALLLEGMAREPSYDDLYQAGTDYYLPKWKGSSAALERWARLASSHVATKGVNSAYARIYWHAFQAQYGRDVFVQTSIDWSQFKRSASALLDETNAPENIGRIALLTCVAGDRTETKRLFGLTAEPVAFYPWSSETERDACLAWARTPAWKAKLNSFIEWVAPYVFELLKVVSLFRRGY
jgi:hypothetical protein